MTPQLQDTTAARPDRSQPLMSALSDFLRDLRKPTHLLIAISGGSDSTGLLVGLASALSAFPDIHLSAATIDHALRPEAAAEARAVAQLCSDLGIFHVIRRWEGEKPATGLSAAAREARYSLLSQIADEIGATAIVTGHTAEDQVETVVMRAERVTTTGQPENAVPSPGLSGMAPATLLDGRHWILRPLLHTSRADIRAYLTAIECGWIDDPSNADPHYERVRTRQTLASDGAGHGPDRIAAAGQGRALLARDAADWLGAYASVEHAVLAKIAPDGLNENPATVRHALSTLAAVLGGRPYTLSRENGDRLMTFLTSGTHGRMTASRVVFDMRRGGLYILRENRSLPHLIAQPGKAVMWDNRFLVANHSSLPIEISPGLQDAIAFQSAPPGLARLAARVCPDIAEKGGGDVSVWAHLAPFDRFLPVFDLPLASRIAQLMGREPYLLPPV